MEDKEFDQLTPEEKKARFQKAVDDYNSGFVEVDYTFRSVASSVGLVFSGSTVSLSAAVIPWEFI